MAPIPWDPGTGMAGKWWLARGSDPPPRPAAGGTCDSSGLGGLGAPAELCQNPVCPWGGAAVGEEGGLGGFPGCCTPKGLGMAPGLKGAPTTPELGRWVTHPPCQSSAHQHVATKGDLRDCHLKVLARSSCHHPAPAMAPADGGTFLGDSRPFHPRPKRAHGVTAGCCKPGPARNAAAGDAKR